MIDLSSKKMLSPKLNAVLDAALERERDQQPKREYLGGSEIGHECERQLQFSFFNVERDVDKYLVGRKLRIFERGHWAEAAMIRWMRLSGVEILTEDKDGEQFGFSEAGGLFKGHCDGIIVGGPSVFGPFPRLWENKGLKAAKWRSFEKHGLRHFSGTYWGQVQVYQDRFDLRDNPALFSAVNMDTMEIHWEAVPFNPMACEALSVKAARILRSCLAGELLPRISQDPTFYQCKFCDWCEHCHQMEIK
ncbi:hypothetical protein JWJ90_13240 [Desulfobulbus rhabdoformis]|uniref:hypothetical protein n=1 Tax=Desulfobulbus rhabdoformis TaxID=34032 RepID=UPI001965F1AD|nr:hypothetical protein [Desulfobulbus rhabdoformis]MBM9615244.1 hypothetical protein [Desulfobulbus rhabdoformis]